MSDQIMIARLHNYKSVLSTKQRVEDNKRAYTASRLRNMGFPDDEGTTLEPKKILDGREPLPASSML